MTCSRPLARRAALLTALLAVHCCALLGLPGAAARAAAPALQAAPTTGLLAGSAVSVTGTGRAGDAVTVLQCRQGTYARGSSIVAPVPYAGHSVPRWDADCDPDYPDPKIDNSGRAQLGVYDATGHLSLVTHVFEGTTTTDRSDVDYQKVTVSIPCDPASPCALVVIDGTYKVLTSFPLTFSQPPAASCAAPTAATATGGGPFSLSPTYARWATSSCATGTASPLLADYTDTGEYSALGDFASDSADYALSATGFTTPGGSDVTSSRPAVFTPVAAQAAVITYDGGSVLQDRVSGLFAAVPVTDLSLTMSEVAQLFSSPFGTSGAQSPQIVARNPQLTRLTGTFGQQQTLLAPDGVLATPDASVLAMTTAWSALPASPWTHGALRAFPASLGTGSSDTSQIPLLATLPALRTQVLGSAFSGHADPAHEVFLYLTDSATAAELGLNVVKLQNASGAFVAPTAASVAAGLSHMTRTADGLLVPDASAPDPVAYPLPLVEYAVTPATAEPAAHLGPLEQFLAYATGDGQEALPAGGVFPLGPDLQAQAVASLAHIGAPVPPTAAPTAPTAAGTGPTAAGAPPFTGPASGVPTGTVPLVPGSAPAGPTGVPAGPSSPATATSSPAAAPVSLPVFRAATTSTTARLLPEIGVLALALLLGGATYTTSGRPLPALARARAGLSRHAAPLGRQLSRLRHLPRLRR